MGDVPVLFGASRKSFLTLASGPGSSDSLVPPPPPPPAERLGASIAAAMHAARAGVRILRVHDVRATRQAIDMSVVLDTPPGHADSSDRPVCDPRELVSCDLHALGVG
jgi:dihydropteroate synthase